MTATARALPWYWLGRVEYRLGVAVQEALRARLLSGDDGAAALLLLEHDPVITLGRHADRTNLVADRAELGRRGIAVVESSRGGDVTYHGPGQLVVYPVLRLEGSVVDYLAAVAGALAEVADRLGVASAEWRRDPAGLWVGSAKLAACGLHVHRGVTVHGWALNVTTPPDVWRAIVPCGLRDHRVTSIAEQAALRGGAPPPSVAEVASLVAPIVCRVLERSALRRVCPFVRESDTIIPPTQVEMR